MARYKQRIFQEGDIHRQDECRLFSLFMEVNHLEDKKLLSTKEAAAFLGVSDRTIQNYRKDGILVPDQFGKNNSVFYSKKQLIEVVKRLISSGETFREDKTEF